MVAWKSCRPGNRTPGRPDAEGRDPGVPDRSVRSDAGEGREAAPVGGEQRVSGCGSASRPSAVAAPRVVVLRRAEERRKQTVARPELPLGNEVGEEHVGLGQDGSALLRPVGDDLVGGSKTRTWLSGPTQTRARPISGSPRPRASHSPARTSWTRSVVTVSQSPTEGQPVPPFSSWVRVDSGMISPGWRPRVRRSWIRAPWGWRTWGWSRESAATTVVLISWVPESG